MPLSEEVHNLILIDLIMAFQAKYGENWMNHLTTNLRPSPIQHIVEERGVKVSDVRKVRSQLMAMGRLLTIFHTMSEPIPSQTPAQEWSIQ
jgi:hypothetical protein